MRLNAFDLHRIQKILNLFDESGIQVEGKVFVENTGEMTVEYDGFEDRHYMTHIVSVE